ncbi:MAG: EI24 domain-containing protein [Anaerolineae bacterium]|nr:EI24 domain-containing protein [Gloeobacterales cyanobacterium ES-bin-313]
MQTLLSPFVGSSYPFRAIALLWKHPRLWPYLVWPIVVNILVFAVLTFGLFFPGLQAIDHLFSQAQGWLLALEQLLRILFFLLLFFLNSLLLITIGISLGAPWYGTLSRVIEEIVTQKVVTEIPTKFWPELRRALGCAVGRLGIALIALVAILPLNLVPVIGPVLATVGNFLVGALLVSLDFLDAALDRRLLTFTQKLDYLKRYPALCAGFGVVSLPLSSIPLLNFITIPICVAAGTLLYCEVILPEDLQKQ